MIWLLGGTTIILTSGYNECVASLSSALSSNHHLYKSTVSNRVPTGEIMPKQLSLHAFQRLTLGKLQLTMFSWQFLRTDAMLVKKELFIFTDESVIKQCTLKNSVPWMASWGKNKHVYNLVKKMVLVSRVNFH